MKKILLTLGVVAILAVFALPVNAGQNFSQSSAIEAVDNSDGDKDQKSAEKKAECTKSADEKKACCAKKDEAKATNKETK